MAPLIRDRHRLERSTQVGFTRLAHISSPISGKPEIGVYSAPLRAALRPGYESEMHFGETNPTGIWPSVVPAKAGTHNHRRWLWVPALPSLSRGSAGTTIAWSARRTNLRLCEMAVGAISIVSD
jgi:hypothetical protein